MNWISYLLALGAGMINPAQSGCNAQLNKTLQAPMLTSIWVYVSGLAGVLLIFAFAREGFPGNDKLAQVPWWAWLGGLLSIASTVAGLTLAQKMGAGMWTGFTVTASLVTSILLDHYGLIGFKEHPASPLRMFGGALMVAGLWLISKF